MSKHLNNEKMTYLKIHVLLSLLIKLSFGMKQVTNLAIGFVYCEPDELRKAEQIIDELNAEVTSLNSKSRITMSLQAQMLKPNDNTISVSLSVCQNLIKKSVYAVIVGKSDCLADKGEFLNSNVENDFISTLSAVAFSCSYYQIPIIDLFSRDAIYSDKVKKLFKLFCLKNIFLFQEHI